MKNLTAVILSKDDKDVIADAIISLAGFADEVIVVDANKNSETQKIAEKLGAKVVKNQFKDFADQRNFGMYQATTPWVYFMDSDERVTPNFKEEVLDIIKQYHESEVVAGYFVKRKTFYYGHDWNFQDSVQRLFVRSKFVEWKGVVHETPIVKGEFGTISAPIIHLTHRNLSQMVRKTNEWSEFEAKLRLESKHPPLAPWRFIRVMSTEFFASYFKNKGYKNGTVGLIEAMYQSFSIFITYAKLWEMQQNKRSK